MSPQPSPRRHARTLAAALLAVTAAAALTACQDGKADGAQSPSSAASDGGSSGTASGADGGGTGAQDTGGAAGTSRQPTAARSAASTDNSPHRCTAASVRMALGRPDPGAGNIHYSLTFTNNGKQSCTLRGFPGVSLLAKDGQSVGKPATREGAAGAAVTLAPGSSAHAVLHTVSEGTKGSGCWPAGALVQAYPPGSKESMTARASGLRVCGAEFSVTTVAPGAAA
ncbi:DUF4232 domain-containing protein [Streptomyces kronopolitis]|uniref:DUF4232 domain-containing protein n=1 Tax=Streptomyces kronopolitis TaxID=1612435 RepID=UPI003D9913CA